MLRDADPRSFAGIYIVCGRTDLRYGIDSLAAIIERQFHKDLFNKFCEIFDRYASDEELNLQPGPSYFLTLKDGAEEIMQDRMVYELLPLIKEYLAEGLMRKASDSFAQLFYEYTGKFLYE